MRITDKPKGSPLKTFFVPTVLFISLLFGAIAQASEQASMDIELSGESVAFIIKNSLQASVVPRSVTLFGEGNCKISVPLSAVASISAGERAVVATYALEDLLKSCAVVPGARAHLGNVRSVSVRPSYDTQGSRTGIWHTTTKSISFGYEVKFRSKNMEHMALTAGYVHFVSP